MMDYNSWTQSNQGIGNVVDEATYNKGVQTYGKMPTPIKTPDGGYAWGADVGKTLGVPTGSWLTTKGTSHGGSGPVYVPGDFMAQAKNQLPGVGGGHLGQIIGDTYNNAGALGAMSSKNPADLAFNTPPGQGPQTGPLPSRSRSAQVPSDKPWVGGTENQRAAQEYMAWMRNQGPRAEGPLGSQLNFPQMREYDTPYGPSGMMPGWFGKSFDPNLMASNPGLFGAGVQADQLMRGAPMYGEQLHGFVPPWLAAGAGLGGENYIEGGYPPAPSLYDDNGNPFAPDNTNVPAANFFPSQGPGNSQGAHGSGSSAGGFNPASVNTGNPNTQDLQTMNTPDNPGSYNPTTHNYGYPGHTPGGANPNPTPGSGYQGQTPNYDNNFFGFGPPPNNDPTSPEYRAWADQISATQEANYEAWRTGGANPNPFDPTAPNITTPGSSDAINSTGFNPQTGGALPTNPATVGSPDQALADDYGNQTWLEMLAEDGGYATDSTEAFQTALDANERWVDRRAADLQEKFNVMGGRFGTDYGKGMSDFFSQTTKDENALRANLTYQSQEAARARELAANQQLAQQAFGGVSQLSSQDFQSKLAEMGYGFGAAQSLFGGGNQAAMLLAQLGGQGAQGLSDNSMNAANEMYGVETEAGFQEAQRQQQLRQFLLGAAPMLSQLWGQNLQTGSQLGGQNLEVLQNQIDRAYQSWQESQPEFNPLLPLMFSSATGFAPVYPMQSTGWMDVLGAGLGAAGSVAQAFKG